METTSGRHGTAQTYFDWATIGRLSNEEPAGLHKISSMSATMQSVIKLTAAELRCSPVRVILTDSTTQGIDTAFDALTFRRPASLIVSDCIFPTILGSARHFVMRLDELGVTRCRLSFVKTSAIRRSSSPIEWSTSFLKMLLPLLGNEPSVVLLEHVDHRFGVRAPLDSIVSAIRRSRPNCSIVVDGAQGAGLFSWRVPKDVWYAGDYHKYFNGPAGTGFLIAPTDFKRTLPQWVSCRTLVGLKRRGGQTPTESMLLWDGCLDALQRIRHLDYAVRQKRVHNLRIHFQQALTGSGLRLESPVCPELGSSILALTVPTGRNSALLLEKMEAKGFRVKPTKNGFRISFHDTLSLASVATLAKELKTFVR